MCIEQALAEFSLTARPAETARHMMRLSLLDWAVCALAGQGEDVSRIVRQMALAEGGTPEATVIGSQNRLPARAAGMVNGTTSHALDYDDTHFAHIGHPSVAVIPAALAVAERVGANGAEFLDAALIGVESSVRVGMWLGRSHYQAGFHQTATAGVFGASLAAGRLLGLDVTQMRHAIGIASTRAAGLKAQFGTMGKPFHAGMAASGGVEAAALAKTGFLSDIYGLSGANGFGATHVGEANDGALNDLGQEWVFEGISHKFHACCHGLHAMLEAMGTLRGLFEPVDVLSLNITTHPRWKLVCYQTAPDTGLGSKFSYAQTAAMAVCGVDTAALDSFSDSMAVDAGLVEMRKRVKVTFDAEIPETASRVEVVLRESRTLNARFDLAVAIPIKERETKLLGKANSLLSEGAAKDIWSAIDPQVDLSALLAALTRTRT